MEGVSLAGRKSIGKVVVFWFAFVFLFPSSFGYRTEKSWEGAKWGSQSLKFLSNILGGMASGRVLGRSWRKGNSKKNPKISNFLKVMYELLASHLSFIYMHLSKGFENTVNDADHLQSHRLTIVWYAH